MDDSGIDQEWYAAVHEASHAVTSLAVGRPVVKAWVDGVIGLVQHEAVEMFPPENDIQREWLKRNLVITVAGRLGEEAQLIQEIFEVYPCDKAWDDLKGLGIEVTRRRPSLDFDNAEAMQDPESDSSRARQMVHWLSPPPPVPAAPKGVSTAEHFQQCHLQARRLQLAEIRRAEVAADQILERHWQEVQKLAFALYKRQPRAMTGKQIVRLVGQSIQPYAGGPMDPAAYPLHRPRKAKAKRKRTGAQK